MRTIIFANGALNRWPSGLEPCAASDRIIAADGGLAHCLKWHIKPHVVIGDMDSAAAHDLKRLENEGVALIRYPAHKDKTDLELAIERAMEEGISHVIILGALGLRWDMTFSTLLMLAVPRFKNLDIRLLDEAVEIRRLHADQTAVVRGQVGDTLSLLALTENAGGVSLEGLEYPLEQATLHLGSSRGVSNVFKKPTARIRLQSGCLLIIVTHQR